MTKHQDQTHQLLYCKLCLKEIPPSGASSDETSDYVAHFCGLDCYEQWRQQQPDPAPTDKPTDD